jgi:hypothetical protein
MDDLDQVLLGPGLILDQVVHLLRHCRDHLLRGAEESSAFENASRLVTSSKRATYPDQPFGRLGDISVVLVLVQVGLRPNCERI